MVGGAKAGREEDCDLLGESCIIAATGEIVAEADLDPCREILGHIFNFASHREPQIFGLISRPKDAAEAEDDASAYPKRGGQTG